MPCAFQDLKQIPPVMTNTQTAAFLCQCLVWWNPELTAAAEQTIRQGLADWQKVLRWASQQQIAPLLHSSLSRSGLLAHVPADGVEYLLAVWSLNRQRSRMLREALLSVCGQLNAAGIVPLLLKGANALLPDDYPGAFDRMTADIDLLIPAGRAGEADGALRKNGFRPLYQSGESYCQERHHDMPLLHPVHPVRIELHRRVMEAAKFDDLTQLAWDRATVREDGGAKMAVPDPTFRVLHSFLHRSIADHAFAENQTDLRGLIELTLLRHHWRGSIDYGLLHDICRKKKVFAAWQSCCLRCEELFGLPSPCPAPQLSYARSKNLLARLSVEFPVLSCVIHWLLRACRLPARLVTPSWYAVKIQAVLRSREEV
ncbi:MAG: nucleotidyltransferase domain-containing protein [Candidatus Electronema sp. V4]|uniref:nucleotidyltransferase domain-containing protein n=1 Tax=Candidatus Electronema sp. V4 TaxID=3454756 RepID=UPI0040554EB9